MIDDARFLDTVLRTDFNCFARKTFHTVAPAQTLRPNWHIEAVAYHLMECLAGGIKRLIINLPPRNLKSILGSVAYPAWALGHDPSLRIICASYSNDLTAKHARDCRAVMQSHWYRRLFPGTRLDPAKNAELEFETTARGFRLGTSVGGTLTGRGGNFVIIDDPIKPHDAMSDVKRSSVNEWFDRTLYSRLDDKRDDVIIVIMQRVHAEDLVGYVLEKEPWVVLSLPAIAETDERIPIGPNRYFERRIGEPLHADREPVEVLNKIKAEMGSFNFSAQYQQCPIPPDGEIIKWKWFKRFDVQPEREANDEVVQSWDTASKAEEIHDYSVCTTWLIKGNEYYLLDVLRERLKYPDLKRRIIEHAQRFNASSILIEDKGSGTSLIQDIGNENVEGLPKPIPYEPEGDKVTRMYAQSATIEAGQVFLLGDAHWLDDFRIEILQFPLGRYDDQVDSMSQFLDWARNHRATIILAPAIMVHAPIRFGSVDWTCH